MSSLCNFNTFEYSTISESRFCIAAMVRWLNSMRNTPYGFASTTDTLTALTALRRVAEAFVNRRLWIMDITVTPAASSTTYSVTISNTTFSQVQYVPIVKPYGSVMEKALGTGWALFQVQYSDLQTPFCLLMIHIILVFGD
jgi:hypothetical protein